MRDIHFHWQNLNEKRGDRLGSPLRHGRAWLRAWQIGLNWSWNFFHTLSSGVELAATQREEVGFTMSFRVPYLFSFWLTIWGGPFAAVAMWLLKRSGARHEDRELALRLFDAALWWTVWRDNSSWSSTTPRWREGSFHFDDFFLGKPKYIEREYSAHDVIIPMPERGYVAKVRLYEVTSKRPRWFAKRMDRADIQVPSGVPFPGKGENSWDCGEDATYSLSCGARTIEAAIGALVESVLSKRRRYGGSVDWRPSASERIA